MMAVSVRGSGGKAGDLVERRAWLRGNQRNNKELSYEYRGCNKLLVGGTVSVMAADPWNVLVLVHVTLCRGMLDWRIFRFFARI